MKYSPRFAYTFTPGSATLNLSGNAGFALSGLLAVVDVTQDVVIYAVGQAALGYSAYSAGTLTLQAAMTGLLATDVLAFWYDDGSALGTDPDTVNTTIITTSDLVVAAPAGDGSFRSGIPTAGSTVMVKCPGGDTSWTCGVTGLTQGTLYFEVSPDSTTGTDGNWIAVNARQTGVVNTVLGNSATANGMYRGNTSGVAYIRVRAVGTLIGTPLVTLRIAGGVGAIFLNASIPAGGNLIGNVGVQGSDGYLPHPLRTDNQGNQTIAANDFAVIVDVLRQIQAELTAIRFGLVALQGPKSSPIDPIEFLAESP